MCFDCRGIFAEFRIHVAAHEIISVPMWVIPSLNSSLPKTQSGEGVLIGSCDHTTIITFQKRKRKRNQNKNILNTCESESGGGSEDKALSFFANRCIVSSKSQLWKFFHAKVSNWRVNCRRKCFVVTLGRRGEKRRSDRSPFLTPDPDSPDNTCTAQMKYNEIFFVIWSIRSNQYIPTTFYLDHCSN